MNSIMPERGTFVVNRDKCIICNVFVNGKKYELQLSTNYVEENKWNNENIYNWIKKWFNKWNGSINIDDYIKLENGIIVCLNGTEYIDERNEN